MRRLALLFELAWRSLLQNRLSAALMVAAVAGGVAFRIPNTANLLGYRDEVLRQGVEAGFGSVRLRPRRGQRFADGAAVAAQAGAAPGVRAAVPILTLAGALGRRGQFRHALVVGVNPAAARQPYQVVRGVALAAGDGDRGGAVIGSTLASRLGVGVGDAVQLRVIFGSDDDLVGEDAVGRYDVVVRGVAVGSFVAPESVFVNRAFLSAELGAPGSASMVLVHAGDHEGARDLAAALSAALGEVEASAWMDDAPFLGAAVRSSTAVGAVSHAMVVLAVLIPVWALLYIHVLHKQRQIALLGALGFSRADVFAAYLLQALLVGVAGVAIGCAGGYGLVRWFAGHPIFQMEGFVVRPVITVGAFVEPALIVLGAALLAGVLPARRAARLDPARALRGPE